MTNSLSFFFVKHVLLAGELYGFYLAPYFLSQIAAIPLWFKLSRRIGKHRATMAAIFWYSIWSCFIPYHYSSTNLVHRRELTHLTAMLPVTGEPPLIQLLKEFRRRVGFFVIMCLKGRNRGLSALPMAIADVIDSIALKPGKTRRRILRYMGYDQASIRSDWSLVRRHTIVVQPLADPINDPNLSSLLWLACLYSIVPAIFKFIAILMLGTVPDRRKADRNSG